MAFSGFVQGLTGFGFGICAMGILPLMMPLQATTMLVILLSIIVCSLTFCSYWKNFVWKDTKWLIFGSLVGNPIGLFFLINAPVSLTLKALGITLLMVVGYEWFFRAKSTKPLSRVWELPIGIFSGMLSGAFNMGGPPLVAYTYSQPWLRQKVIASLQMVFLCSCIWRGLLSIPAGLFSVSVLKLAVWAALPIWAGVELGKRSATYLPEKIIRQGIFISLAILGILYVFSNGMKN